MYKMKQKNENQFEIEKTGEMKVPGVVFANEELFSAIKQDKTLSQVENVAKLPGIIKGSFVMPDAHQGYGFPIGGVAAFDTDTGIISPGGVGYDINCGVRLLKTNLTKEDIIGHEQKILETLFEAVPTGVGCKGELKISYKDLDEIMKKGSNWMEEKGFATKEDVKHTEEEGCIKNADPRNVSKRAKGRGMNQVGTLGAGNHFLDVLVVSDIFDEEAAKAYGLEKNKIVILIHCGSRGLGHQVASDYIKEMDTEFGHPKYDRELVHAPIKSNLGKNYLSAMACAANFAFANRQLITHNVREAMKKHYPNFSAEVVYDICHNIAKFEKHKVEGKQKEVLVMRKGATRSFGPGRTEIPKKYQEVGQPVLIPGSMGTASYVLCGTTKAEKISFGSTAHGAGRIKSRTQAKKDNTYEEAKEKMKKRKVFVKSGSHKGMIEEAPESYKDIEEVINVSHNSGIGKKVARLNPLLVVIG